MRKIHFFNVGHEHIISGGYLYNKHLIDELRKAGQFVFTYFLNEQQQISAYLNQIEAGDILVIDSLLLVEEAAFILANKTKFSIYGLVHLPQSFDPQKVESKNQLLKIEKSVFEAIPIIVTSDFIKNEISNQFQITPKNIFVNTPGVRILKKKNKFNEKPFQLINVANLVEGKGHRFLINAMAQLKDFDWQLLIYGKATKERYKEELEEMIDSLGLSSRIKLMGVLPLNLLNQKMIESDLFIQVSKFETYSMIIAEALSSCLPFVSTKVGAWKKFSKFDGGVFLDDTSEATFIKTMLMLFQDKEIYQKLHTQTNYNPKSWSSVARDFLEIIS